MKRAIMCLKVGNVTGKTWWNKGTRKWQSRKRRITVRYWRVHDLAMIGCSKHGVGVRYVIAVICWRVNVRAIVSNHRMAIGVDANPIKHKTKKTTNSHF